MACCGKKQVEINRDTYNDKHLYAALKKFNIKQQELINVLHQYSSILALKRACGIITSFQQQLKKLKEKLPDVNKSVYENEYQMRKYIRGYIGKEMDIQDQWKIQYTGRLQAMQNDLNIKIRKYQSKMKTINMKIMKPFTTMQLDLSSQISENKSSQNQKVYQRYQAKQKQQSKYQKYTKAQNIQSILSFEKQQLVSFVQARYLQIDKLTNNIERLKSQLNQKQEYIKRIQTREAQLTIKDNKIKQIQRELLLTKQQLKLTKSQISTSKTNSLKFSHQLDTKQKLLYITNQEQITLSKQNQKNKMKIEQLNKKIQLSDKNISILQQQKYEKVIQNLELQQCIKELTKKLENIKIKSYHQRQDDYEDAERLSDISKTSKKNSNYHLFIQKNGMKNTKSFNQIGSNQAIQHILKKSDLQILKLFYGSKVLQGNNFNEQLKNKQQIIKLINPQNKNINTIKLFNYDPIIQNNLKKYIHQNQKYMLFLAKTISGTIIGGYTQFANSYNSYNCFIFSIGDEIICLKNQTKRIGFKIDDHYMSFGNSQIRVKLGTSQCTSYIGGASIIFSCNRHIQAKQFTKQNGNKFELQCYELYEIDYHN